MELVDTWKNKLKKGFVDTNGSELDSLLPPTSRREGARDTKKKGILEKIREIVEVFIGI